MSRSPRYRLSAAEKDALLAQQAALIERQAAAIEARLVGVIEWRPLSGDTAD
ncbi:MAG: hypothetical protein GVY24_06110 [Planctomycetes bacterium]|jgi:hypothetical protein|nr:hypothetical protein [Planctomycetota bacterium]